MDPTIKTREPDFGADIATMDAGRGYAIIVSSAGRGQSLDRVWVRTVRDGRRIGYIAIPAAALPNLLEAVCKAMEPTT